MAAEPLSVLKILTKLVIIFKHDIYIIDWRYCLGGEKTEEDTPGTAMCVLEEPDAKVFKDTFPDHKFIYIDDIRKYKVDPDNHIQFQLPLKETSELSKKRDEYVSIISDIAYWRPLDLNDKQVDLLFSKMSMTGIKFSEKYTLSISKTLFPLTTPATHKNLLYYILRDTKNRGGVFLIIKQDYPMFSFYNFVYYLSIE